MNLPQVREKALPAIEWFSYLGLHPKFKPYRKSIECMYLRACQWVPSLVNSIPGEANLQSNLQTDPNGTTTPWKAFSRDQSIVGAVRSTELPADSLLH